jgi:rhamnopyranosyl-N-acetylglucosaminyl-diphospho-decaprenol beta-1,3/1,4-galactofuranosyltransferase
MVEHQRVCAVVVTYNRKELLRGCLDALLAQSYPVHRVLVIDNASTDGTGEFLSLHGYDARRSIEHLLLPENVGGAGGFHEGFKRALTFQPDWIWAMDDDGLPAPDCLEQLLAAPASDFRGPLVLARERMEDAANEELAFPGVVQRGNTAVQLKTAADARSAADDGVVSGYASVFNGVLIHRRVVERIGVPDDRFFIWGDEWDYFFRARAAGVPLTSVLRARYWHPRDRTERAKIRFAGTEYEVPCSDCPFRNYLLIRNHAYLAHRYRGIVAWLRHTLKYLVFHKHRSGGFRILEVLRFSIEGLIGRFNGRGTFR